MTPISKPQADRLAALAAALRPIGAPAWDTAGILAAIANTRHDHPAADICHALIALATDPTIRTPAVLGNDGTHWPAKTRPTPTPPRYIPTPKPDVDPDKPAHARQQLAAAKATR